MPTIKWFADPSKQIWKSEDKQKATIKAIKIKPKNELKYFTCNEYRRVELNYIKTALVLVYSSNKVCNKRYNELFKVQRTIIDKSD